MSKSGAAVATKLFSLREFGSSKSSLFSRAMVGEGGEREEAIRDEM